MHAPPGAGGRPPPGGCLLYTSDAADERSSVDLGGRRIINKKTMPQTPWQDDGRTIETNAVKSTHTRLRRQ